MTNNNNNPIDTLLEAVLERASENTGAQEPQLAKPTDQLIDEHFVAWTWDTGNWDMEVRASVERATGDYFVYVNNNRLSIADVAALARILVSAVEWEKLWKLFLAEYLVPEQSNSQQQEFVLPITDDTE